MSSVAAGSTIWITVWIVIDSSALAEILMRTPRAPLVEELLVDADLIAPDLINAEVLSVVRGWLLRHVIDGAAAQRAVENLAMAPVRRMTTAALISRMWDWRQNLTPYDASYVALAQRLACPLLTLDHRLTRAPGLGVEVRTVESQG